MKMTCNEAIKKMQKNIKIIKACYKEYVTEGSEEEQKEFFISGEFKDMFECILEYEYQCDTIFNMVTENRTKLKEFEDELEGHLWVKTFFSWIVPFRNNSNDKVVKKITAIREDTEQLQKSFHWFELHIKYLIPSLTDFKSGDIEEAFAREKLAEALEMLEEEEET